MALVEHTALAPFLDLFVRMTDAQLAKLTDVPTSTVAAQRKTVVRIMGQLEPFEDLLPRLEDDALARLTQTDVGIISFWRACCIAPARTRASSTSPGDATSPPPAEAKPAARDEDEDDAFVLTIDEDDDEIPGKAPRTGGDPMDWGDM